MIEKFKTNAEVIENGDKYLYGNHVRMPLSIERGEALTSSIRTATSTSTSSAVSPSTVSVTAIPRS